MIYDTLFSISIHAAKRRREFYVDSVVSVM